MSIPSSVTLKVSVPSDEDGFVSLKCPFCGEHFKADISELNANWHINVWCPQCGLKGMNFWDIDTEHKVGEVIDNQVADLTNEVQAMLAKAFSGNSVSFRPGKKAKIHTVTPIVPKTANLEITYFGCCKLVAKLEPILKFGGCYCPYCGEINDGTN